MVHWVGNGSKVVICLARDPAIPIFDVKLLNPSSVFISYDDGDSYQDKTDQFKLANGSLSILEKFYTHPTYDTHVSSKQSIPFRQCSEMYYSSLYSRT